MLSDETIVLLGHMMREDPYMVFWFFLSTELVHASIVYTRKKIQDLVLVYLLNAVVTRDGSRRGGDKRPWCRARSRGCNGGVGGLRDHQPVRSHCKTLPAVVLSPRSVSVHTHHHDAAAMTSDGGCVGATRSDTRQC